eukprot:snap_masked-scaffold_7-processed-gene-11.24-mRNA-1 protein AED:0.75 eAED:0.76 QI:0/0/0/1/1/1/2/0/94
MDKKSLSIGVAAVGVGSLFYLERKANFLADVNYIRKVKPVQNFLKSDLMGKSVLTLLDETVKKYPKRLAMIFTEDDRTFTYTQLQNYSTALATM